jgi:hypothetical protein
MADNGFVYARGPYETDERPTASAFSKGDILMLDSNSSLSRVNPYGTQDNYAIALADSTQSIRDKCVVMIPKPDTEFWASISTALGSHLTPGVESGISFAVANGRYFLDGSTTTARAVVVKGTDEIDQSIRSHVLARLIYHAGNLEIS